MSLTKTLNNSSIKQIPSNLIVNSVIQSSNSKNNEGVNINLSLSSGLFKQHINNGCSSQGLGNLNHLNRDLRSSEQCEQHQNFILTENSFRKEAQHSKKQEYRSQQIKNTPSNIKISVRLINKFNKGR